MKCDVFISHSTKDQAAAHEIRAACEAAGLICWIAPRDILAGTSWADAIVDGIGRAASVLLVHSEAAKTSPMVMREIDIAAGAQKTIVPVRIDDATPSQAMLFYLGGTHWFDAQPPLDAHLPQLVRTLQKLLGANDTNSGGTVHEPGPPAGLPAGRPPPMSPRSAPVEDCISVAQHVERRLAAVLMLDVAAYSRLMGMDEVGTHVRLRDKMTAVVEPAIAGAAGRIVKRTGDGALVEFEAAAAAVRCAIAIQRRNEADEQAQDADRRIRFRIGISLGEIIVESDDIYGDGVNVAARLESIADVGGIFLSEAAALASEQVGLPLLDLGLRSLKNITRPIRVYKVALRGETGQSDHVTGSSLVRGFGDKPAIAVLPFRIEPPESDHDHLADGITEDIITALSRWRTFPVISRASVFAFKDKDLDLGFLGQQLGARYIEEGSLRRRGSLLRATISLTDVETRESLVTERFDSDLSDVLDMQDDIVRTIVGAIEPELLRHERERAMRAPLQDATAYEFLQRGLWHHYRYAPQENAKAQALLRNALAIDGNYAPALAALSLTLGYAAQARFVPDPKATFQEARALARRAVDIDPRDPQARFALGNTLFHTGLTDLAARELQAAIRLNPSHAAAHANLAFVYNYLNRPEEALQVVELALRLSPYDPRRFIWLPALAGANYLAGKYPAALRAGEEALAANAGYLPIVRYIVAALGQMGRVKETAAVMPLLRQLDGSLANTEAHLSSYFVAPAVALILDGLRKAGFD